MSMQISASKNVATPTRRSGRLMMLSKPKTSNQPPIYVDLTSGDHDSVETPARRRKGNIGIVTDKNDCAKGTPVRNQRCMKEVSVTSKYEVGECSRAANKRQSDKRLTVVAGKRKTMTAGGKRAGSVVGKAELDENDAHRHHRLRIRNSPLSLYLLVQSLSDAQKKDIRELGFDSIIDFKISELPTILAQMAVDAFDHVGCVLNVKGKLVKVTKETINEYLGVPIGGERVNACKSAKVQDMITKSWRTQFKQEHKRISANNVYDEMLKQKSGGRMFKLNFLVLFVTIMAEGNKCSTVNQKFLPCLNDLDKVKRMDWCGYILECLMRTKQEWGRTKHYNGPLLFLVVLYANTLSPKKVSENVDGPVMNLWTADALFEVQKGLIKKDGGGVVKKEQVHGMASGIHEKADMNEAVSTVNSNKRMRLSGGVDAQRVSGKKDSMSQPSIQECKAMVSRLFDNIKNEITKVSEILQSVVAEYTEDVELQEMELMRSRIIMSLQTEVKAATYPSTDVGKDYNGVMMLPETQFFASPTVMKSIELSETKHLKEVEMHKKAATEVRSKETEAHLGSPNWDLGITQQMQKDWEENDMGIRRLSFGDMPEIPKKQRSHVSREVSSVDLDVDAFKKDDMMMETDGAEQSNEGKDTEALGMDGERLEGRNVAGQVKRTGKEMMPEKPKMDPKNKLPETRQYGRGLRERRVPDILLSPYLQREVNVRAKLSVDETNTSGCVFAATRDPRFVLFRTRSFSAERLVFESMVPDVPVDKMVINAWSFLLNYEERLRNPSTMGRLFCTANMVTTDMISNVNDYDKQSLLFGREMEVSLKSSPFKSLADVELVFFPLQKDGNWYVICFNLKKPTLHVLDSCKRTEVNLLLVYGEVPLFLVRMLTDYMTTLKHPQAEAMMNPGARIVKMRSQTESHTVDSGIFAMRYMEMYKGKSDRFEVGLEAEGASQKAMLNSLRVKFLTKILTSVENSNRKMVEMDVEDYCLMTADKKKKLNMTATDRIRKRLVRLK